MCDYSLHQVASRAARVGDRLLTSEFRNTSTRGFAAADDPNLAVCLLPGTELAFEANVEWHCPWPLALFLRKDKRKMSHKLGRFRQINLDIPATHHDAIEFADGKVVLLTRLRPGQCATVLQLPARARATAEARNDPRPASAPVNSNQA